MATPEETEQVEEVDELFPGDSEPDIQDLLDASTAEIEELDADNDIEIVESDPAPIGKAWAFDFTQQRFVMDGNSPAAVRGDAAIIQWVEKCLRTQQGSSVVHPPEFGLVQPLSDYLGTVVDEDDLSSLASDIQEALVFHPAISAVEDIQIELGETLDIDGAIEVSFLVILGDGTEVPFEAELEPEAAA